MNRIREIREARGISQAELAKRVRTSQPQIKRLEQGERRLTEDWMRRIAKALDVNPADLLAVAVMAEFNQDVEPYRGDKEISTPLQSLGIAPMRIISNVLERIGKKNGDVILVDGRDVSLKSLSAGDVVVAQIKPYDSKDKPINILRQFVPPALLTTNRDGSNLSIDIQTSGLEIIIIGLVIERGDQVEH